MEAPKYDEWHVCSLHKHFRVGKKVLNLGWDQVRPGDHLLSFRLSLILRILLTHFLDELLISGRQFLWHSLCMVKFLLLDAGFKLSLVLQGLSAHFFLTSNTLFVGFPALVSHLLFLLEHLLVSLEIELHLVFGLPLVHFELKLLGLPTFFFCYLRFLHLQLATNMKKSIPTLYSLLFPAT